MGLRGTILETILGIVNKFDMQFSVFTQNCKISPIPMALSVSVYVSVLQSFAQVVP